MQTSEKAGSYVNRLELCLLKSSPCIFLAMLAAWHRDVSYPAHWVERVAFVLDRYLYNILPFPSSKKDRANPRQQAPNGQEMYAYDC
jgi:hypothetical protein